MHTSQVLTSYSQPNFDEGYLSQFELEMFDFFTVRFY